jgi:hypothetical protein
MTDSKDKRLHVQLQADGYMPSGEIWRNQAGDVTLVEMGVIRKLDLDQMFQIMHPHEPRPEIRIVRGVDDTEHGLMP